jgi:hypothetical protein
MESHSVKAMCYWNHGASFPIDTYFTNTVTLGVVRDRNLPIWLHRSDYREYFTQTSKSIHDVGSPYIYVAPENGRISGSVLIMPGHTLHPDSSINDSQFHDYVSDVKNVYPPSEKTFVCLNSNCLKNGYWVTEFSKAGYAVIAGSRSDDANSYIRMKRLFSTFETVISNMMGSHIVYAAAEGCNVGIWGEQLLLEQTIDVGTGSVEFDYFKWRRLSEKEYPFLFVDAGNETSCTDWGNYILGYKHKQSPKCMESLIHEAQRYYEQWIRRQSIVSKIGYQLKRLIRRS